MNAGYDAVVIGAGIGGLTAGALLAKKGYSVAVFEAQPQPGGYCTSFRRRGYTFDSCLDAVSGCGETGWLRRVLRQLEVEDDVGLVRLDPLRVDFFGGEEVAIPGEFGQFRELLFSVAPDERAGADGLLKKMEEIYRTAMATTPEVLYCDSRLERKSGAVGQYRRLSYKDLLDDFVKDEKVRAVMSDRCAFMGLPPSRVSALAMTTMFMTFGVGGGYRIKDGAGRLAGALSTGLKRHGGELFLRKKVTGIVNESGRAAGVIADGERITAKAVISAVDAGNTLDMAGLGGSESRGLRPSVSFFMVYLGLGKNMELPASAGYYPGFDIEGTFLDTASDIASPKASVEIINYSGISPDMAPEGCTTVMLMSKASFNYRDTWYNCKQREMERLVGLACKKVPGLKENIAYAEAATPLTLGRYTGNAHGAAFGWEQDIDNRRTMAKTRMPGLLLAGHWTYPGGGIESVAASGIIAAEQAARVIQQDQRIA